MKKHLALIAAILILAAHVLGIAVESSLADHDCSGESCPICLILTNVRQSRLSAAICAFVAAAFFGYAIRNLFVKSVFYSANQTLIALKVKLSN